jgi:hypothetical protein
VTILRLERVLVGSFDEAIAALGAVALARSPEGTFLEVADARSAEAERRLAFAGVHARPSSVSLATPRGTRVAIGRDLSPLARELIALDLVHIRPLPLGDETRRLLRTWPWRRPTAARCARCRDLLRGDDIVLGWRRRAWASAAILRAAGVRRALRPVVFDNAALAVSPERRTFARDGALAGWLFG